ncbi:substrate-binding domain-containing protein [Bacillus chungangensis]|uniref:Ribose transport system substrate-binding protein n=1 Tax=Bacillus chungangensis TaxID=587633 RepID=A0ABT9WYT9_9BACI|nr:substrate-binding domain-containing protein [Bacillus chungangensis]MDQ0178461.1 ribose transport system substrate-binding protein [Bacillus chungangensis]
MIRKNLLLAVIVSVLFVMGAACSSNSKSKADKGDMTIGVSTITLQHQFFIDIDKGIQKAAKDLGVNVLINDPNQDLAKQVAAIEDYMQKNVDGLILMATDNAGVIPVVEEAKEKGIPVVTADAVVDSPSIDTFIGTANYEAGQELGNYFKNYLEENGKGNEEIHIAVVTSIKALVQQDRLKGFKDALKEQTNMTFLNDQPGYDREESMRTVENILQANPDVDYIFATAENSVLGSLAALESARQQDVKILGFDVNEEAAKGIKSEYILAMIQQQPELIGETAIRAVVNAIQGKELDKQMSIPVILIDKHNVADYF